MDSTVTRVILVDGWQATREALAKRLRAQGYVVEEAPDAATAADMALCAPPDAVVADLWMPSISGVQLCRLLRSEPATIDVPIILRGEKDDPRSRFWAERAGAMAYVVKGRMSELVRALAKATVGRQKEEETFFLQLSGGTVDIRDRIARYLDAALFDSVIAAEVRALSNCGSFDRLFDLFAQFLSQVLVYRWVALSLSTPERLALHHHPMMGARAELEAKAALEIQDGLPVMHVEDEDAINVTEGPEPIVRTIHFANMGVGRIALGPCASMETDSDALVSLIARELGGPIRMTLLIEESQRMAATDPLTGLMNRREFMAMMRTELSRTQRYGYPLSLVLMDVDHFKSVNDTRGHAAGDHVLSSLGSFLRNHLRVTDLAARWGGEEFVITLTSTGREGGTLVGERLRRAVEEFVINDDQGKRIPITVSVGFATWRPGETLEGLVDRADRAMYTAKAAGRNRLVVCSQDINRSKEAETPNEPANGTPNETAEPALLA